MRSVSRRAILGMGAFVPLLVSPGGNAALFANFHGKPAETVYFAGDGLPLSPSDYAELLVKLSNDGRAKPDRYLAGGCVADLEKQFAQSLGKEQALFIPTGTLANHLALRVLAGSKTRVLVQAESHIYRDSLDSVQTLSHLNLVPLGADKATIPMSEFEEAFRRSGDKPYPLHVGAISIENPVRRRSGESFEIGEMRRVSEFARKHDIRMHLDGARLWIASAYTGVSPKEYADLFDTVYISLYKCFNAGTGAVLAGSRSVIEQVAHARKVFGGGLYNAWPYAAVALHYLEGFADRFQKAVQTSNELFTRLGKLPNFKMEQYANQTNIVRLHLKDTNIAAYQENLRKRGIMAPIRGSNFMGFELMINETLNRLPVGDLESIFIESLPR